MKMASKCWKSISQSGEGAATWACFACFHTHLLRIPQHVHFLLHCSQNKYPWWHNSQSPIIWLLSVNSEKTLLSIIVAQCQPFQVCCCSSLTPTKKN
jgi:hypothetical protein